MTDKGPPVGAVARATVAGVMAAKIGAKKVGLLSKRPFLSRESFDQQQTQNDKEVAQLLFQGLSVLRGTALKLAQSLSLELGMLPDTYRNELYKSHYRVPPLNRAVVRSLLIQEFGKAPEDLFTTFDPTAFAAASLGQVHRASLPTGEHVAVKVQYPGIGTALKTDLRLVRGLMLPFVKTDYVTAALQEVEERLSEEVDYDRERDQTQWFNEHNHLAGVVIPRTFAKYSSKRVLSTELLDGMHLDEWLNTNPSQEQRDQVAQRMYDFFMHSFFELHRTHADPNPGNYLFRDDGTIAVIDFGSVKTFDSKFSEALVRLCRAHLRSDLQGIIDAYCDLGMAHGNRKEVEQICQEKLVPFGQWLMRPYREETFDFGKHADHCAQGAQFAKDFFALQSMNGFTPETIMFDRNMRGLFLVFTELKACVRVRNQWLY